MSKDKPKLDLTNPHERVLQSGLGVGQVSDACKKPPSVPVVTPVPLHVPPPTDQAD